MFVSESEEKAAQVQAMMDHRLLSIEQGKRDEAPSYESVQSYSYSREEMARIQYNRMRMIVGVPDDVKNRLTELVNIFGVDEVVVSTFADHFEDRLASYALLSEMFGINNRNSKSALVNTSLDHSESLSI